MSCLVCGLPEAADVCPRCGTDLRALLADVRPPRLEIARVPARTDARRDP